MNVIWEIIQGWSRFGQFVFFLIILSTLLLFTHRMMFFFTVLLRGWPPKNVTDAMKLLSSSFEDDEKE